MRPLALALAIAALAGCASSNESTYNYQPPDGYVPDAKTAIRIAEAVWLPIYGKKVLDDEKPYLRGAVEYFDDEETEHVPGELLNRALEAHERLRHEIGQEETALPVERTSRDLSFRLADGIDDLDFRSILLQSRSEPQRLRLFAEFVTGYIPRRQYVARMKAKAPTNGSGHKGPGV